MSNTLHQFGRVLFDELEQVAVRRGGFASLMWVKKNLFKAGFRVNKLRKDAAKPKFDLPLLRRKADTRARQARDALALAARTVEAVDQFAAIMHDVVKMAHDVLKNMKRPAQGSAHVPPTVCMDWERSMKSVKLKVERLAETAAKAQQKFSVKEIRGRQQKLVDEEARCQRACRVAWGQKGREQLEKGDQVAWDAAIKALRRETGDKYNNQGNYERLIRGAVVRRSRDIAGELLWAARSFVPVIPAFQEMAKAKQDALVELERLVAEQSAASRYEINGVVEDAARKSSIRMGTVGLAFSGGGIRSATFNLGFLQGAAALGLLKQFEYLSTVSGGGYIGAWFAAWVLREGGGPEDTKPAPEADAKMQSAPQSLDNIQKQLNAKMQRTSQALENVQKQLNSSRGRQARAVRRWAWPADNPTPSLDRTVEDEPEPVHHLREHGNYLAPRLGLLSIDTWTMVSVYLRNLFLNHFIVLPMLLAVVALPRLVLFLFTHSTSGKTIDLAREWLNRNRVWPTPRVFALALVACLLVPKLTDFFAWRIVRRLHRRSVQWAFHSPLVFGMALVATLHVIFVWPSPALAKIGGIVQALDPRAWNPFVTGLTAWVLIFLAAWFGPRINRRRAGDPERSAEPMPYREMLAAWWLLVVLIYGAALLAGWLPSVAPDFVESFVESLTGDSNWLTGDSALFLGTFVLASVGFYWTYESLAKIRPNPRPAPAVPAGHGLRSEERRVGKECLE